MILKKEIEKIAEEKGVAKSTIDKDWVLSHFLALGKPDKHFSPEKTLELMKTIYRLNIFFPNSENPIYLYFAETLKKNYLSFLI